MRLLKRKGKHERKYKMNIKDKLLFSTCVAVPVMFLNIIGTLINKELFDIVSLIKIFVLCILVLYIIISVMDCLDNFYILSVVILIVWIISLFVYNYFLKSNDFHTAANDSFKHSTILAITILVINRKDNKGFFSSKWGILFLVLMSICIVMTLITI